MKLELVANYLARLLEVYDRDTARHCIRVRDLCVVMASQMRLDRRLRQRLGLAAKLHDLGKIAIPKAILHKPGPPTPDEWARLREHAEIGERLLREARPHPTILSAVRGHHERFDGSGYPDGLRGKRIPLLARILTIADCFDALTNPRPYRVGSMKRGDALQYLRKQAGTRFDPTLVLVFVAMMKNERSAPILTSRPQRKLRESRPWRAFNRESTSAPNDAKQ